MIESLAASEDGQSLQISWGSGEQTALPAVFLRKQARDAWTIRQQIDHGDVHVPPDICIIGLQQVGPEGVNVHFSDGHDKAIYPFVYLRELSDRFDN